jgi:hypothetical protein
VSAVSAYEWEVLCFQGEKDTGAAGSGYGGAAVTGYDNVIAMWAGAMVAPQPHVHVRGIQVFYQGDVAVVTSTVTGLSPTLGSSGSGSGRESRRGPKPGAVSVLMTDVFVRPHSSDRFNLVAHIATAAPGMDDPPRGGAPMSVRRRKAAMQAMRETYQDPLRAPKKKPEGGAVYRGSLQDLLTGAVFQGATVEGVVEGEEEEEEEDLYLTSADDDDEEEDEEDEDEEDEEEEKGKETPRQRLKNTIRNTLARVMENGGRGPGVIIMGTSKNGGLSSLMRGGLGGGVTVRNKGFTKGGGRITTQNGKTVINLTDEEDEDEEEDDEEVVNEGKELAARTLLAVRWLHSEQRLSDEDKRIITSDVIRNVASEDFSRAEIAYSLLIGDGLPGDKKSLGKNLNANSNSNLNLNLNKGLGSAGQAVTLSKRVLLSLFGGPQGLGGGEEEEGEEGFDMSLVDEEDMGEFEDVCKVIARELASVN